jgi:hypothetical protein
MSKVVKFELNHAGVKELLKSDEMKSVCESYARRALSGLGAGYSVNTYVGANRCNAEVTADSDKARRENSQNNTILKALGG